MDESVLWSAVVGVLLGLCYIVTSVFVVLLAQQSSRFVPIVLGGMVLRMFGFLVALVIIIMFPIFPFQIALLALTAAFLIVVLIGLFAELTWVIRRKV
ncbi:MAG: hypothetical protein OXL40_04635 [Bacteroidota bacterium]|nr:hypothetical protein [Bacteroidota bacterium]